MHQRHRQQRRIDLFLEDLADSGDLARVTEQCQQVYGIRQRVLDLAGCQNEGLRGSNPIKSLDAAFTTLQFLQCRSFRPILALQDVGGAGHAADAAVLEHVLRNDAQRGVDALLCIGHRILFLRGRISSRQIPEDLNATVAEVQRRANVVLMPECTDPRIPSREGVQYMVGPVNLLLERTGDLLRRNFCRSQTRLGGRRLLQPRRYRRAWRCLALRLVKDLSAVGKHLGSTRVVVLLVVPIVG